MDLSSLLRTSPWLAVPLVLAGAVLSALASGRGRLRTAAALVLAAPAVAVPFLVPASMAIYRFFLTLAALLPVLRAFDRARERRPLSLAHRVWAAVSPFETRTVTRAAPHLDASRFAACAGYVALAALGYWVAFTLAAQHHGALRQALRWGGGAVFVYAAVDAGVALLNAVYRLSGIVLPPMHRAPILSLSLQEFWGERWNLTVRDWFHRHCFLPLARRRRLALGVLAAFGASTVLHVWIALVTAGWVPALMMGSFFVVQGILTVIERRIGVLSWRPALGRAWAVLCLVGSSPLFVEPVLQALGG